MLAGCSENDTDRKPGAAPRRESAAPLAVANDNRSPAGTFRDGVLELRLEARLATWQPDGNVDNTHTVLAFAEEGGAATIPGPLLRVPEGTEVRIRVRNAVPDGFFLGLPPPRYQEGVGSTADTELIVYGLRAGTVPEDALRVPGGETREITFRADIPGTFLYRAAASERTLRAWTGRDSQLAGAIVVDPAGTLPDPAERIFVITMSDAYPDETKPDPGEDLFEPVINGLSWPHTERLHYRVGDTVRWRWVNASGFIHPMHLHGAHFRTLAKGEGVSETIYPDDEVRLVVTELMEPGTTFRMEWVPPREGNWLMHCHFVDHILPFPVRDKATRAQDMHDVTQHALNAMAGLVLGIIVSEREVGAADTLAPQKEVRLIAQERWAPEDDATIRGFALQEDEEPTPGSLTVPGPPIVLTREEKASITVINGMNEPTTVHWHGMELESVYDGVAGWSRSGSRVAPLLAPGDTFTVEMTPPRSGTFIYHTHMGETDQLSSGMYGPLLVLEPGAVFDPSVDRVLTIGQTVDSWVAINGQSEPAPADFRALTEYRLRFINIHQDATVNISLTRDSDSLRWRGLAKDGADLLQSQRVVHDAEIRMGVGETYDFTWTPTEPGDATLVVHAPYPTEPGEVWLRQTWRVR